MSSRRATRSRRVCIPRPSRRPRAGIGARPAPSAIGLTLARCRADQVLRGVEGHQPRRGQRLVRQPGQLRVRAAVQRQDRRAHPARVADPLQQRDGRGVLRRPRTASRPAAPPPGGPARLAGAAARPAAAPSAPASASARGCRRACSPRPGARSGATARRPACPPAAARRARGSTSAAPARTRPHAPASPSGPAAPAGPRPVPPPCLHGAPGRSSSHVTRGVATPKRGRGTRPPPRV